MSLKSIKLYTVLDCIFCIYDLLDDISQFTYYIVSSKKPFEVFAAYFDLQFYFFP